MTTYKRRSQTVSEFLESMLPTKIIRRMLLTRKIYTDVAKATDGNRNRHLINISFPVQLSDERFVQTGETFCGRKSLSLTKDGARKKGVTCEGCVHISRALLARKMLQR